MKVISKNILKNYCSKLITARENYQKTLDEDNKIFSEDEAHYGRQYADIRRKERGDVINIDKENILKEADKLIDNLKILNEQYIKNNAKASEAKEYEKQLAKYMTLSGNKINSKIIAYMKDNYDITGLEFLYNEDSNSKIQTQIKQALRELKAGDPTVNTMIDLLQDSKDKNMYQSGINVLCSKLDEIIEGASSLEPFTPEEALEYLKNKDSATQEECIRYQLYKLGRANNND